MVLRALGVDDDLRAIETKCTAFVLGTLWSLWAELGLSGWKVLAPGDRRRPRSTHSRDGARREVGPASSEEESLDWCVSNGRIASAVRLKHLVGTADVAIKHALGRFAATVNAHAPLAGRHTRSPGRDTQEPVVRHRPI